jgi:NifU-like protein
MIAAADVLAETVRGRSLKTLHGIEFVNEAIDAALGAFPADRGECRNVAVRGLRAALADFREREIGRLAGQGSPVCTCFGITEAEIVRCGGTSVDEVGTITNAGTGCGSCRMLIRELIEAECESCES